MWHRIRTHRLSYLALLVGIVAFSSACTTTTITPEFSQTPTAKYETVIVGDITTDNELWQSRVANFRQGLTQRLTESQAFDKVLTVAPEKLPPSSILLSGRITEVDKGSKALRFIIGFGAGKAHASGLFRIRDDSGDVLAKFESREAYSGGAGIGGVDFLDVDDLMQRLGEETANSVIRWSQGGSLKPPATQ